jgi:hypothetical protein
VPLQHSCRSSLGNAAELQDSRADAIYALQATMQWQCRVRALVEGIGVPLCHHYTALIVTAQYNLRCLARLNLVLSCVLSSLRDTVTAEGIRSLSGGVARASCARWWCLGCLRGSRLDTGGTSTFAV